MRLELARFDAEAAKDGRHPVVVHRLRIVREVIGDPGCPLTADPLDKKFHHRGTVEHNRALCPAKRVR